MFGISPVNLYSLLERTVFWEGFVRANWSESGKVERTARMAQANNFLEGVSSSGYEFARANYFESRRVEQRRVEAQGTNVM